MTRTANARLAGFMFLFYIATGVTSMVLFSRATAGAEGTAAVLANLARHGTTVRLTSLLSLLTFFDAIALAVALYALTRDVDQDLALLALCCRIGEGVLGVASAVGTLGLLSVARASTVAAPADAAAANALGALLLRQEGASATIGAACFAVGSTLFSWLFLRARSIPVPLAWLGVLASLLLVVGLPVRVLGVTGGLFGWGMWLPMLVFEVTLGLWLMIKGA